MLIARYRHRLPAEYDMARVRARIAERAPLWDEAPGLAFKAFTVEDRAAGAAANAYASLYLWRDAGAEADFLAGPGFAAVVAGFGRPRVETWLVLDLRFGAAGHATGLEVAGSLVGEAEADLAAVRAAQARRGREIAGEPDVLASLSGLDPAGWRLTRFTLRAARPDRAEIAHLAAPGLPALRNAL